RIEFSLFLQPELVHAGERVGLFRLQPMPPIEIAAGTIATKEIAVVLHYSRRKFEPDEHQSVLGNEGFDLRNRQSVLLHVKQKVAALAGAEEIAGPGYILEGLVQQVLPAAANLIGGRIIPALAREGASR